MISSRAVRIAGTTLALACGLFCDVVAHAADTAFPEASNAPTAPTFEFARLKSKPVPGDKIGQLHRGMFCSDQGDLRASAKFEEIANGEAALAFKTELAAFGLLSATPEMSSFDPAPPKSDPDYRIGGVLLAISFDQCDDDKRRKGNLSVTVKWEVFAPKLQRIVLTATSTGSFHSDSFETVVGREFESRAYAASLAQLMGDPSFKALRPVAGPGAAPTVAAAPDSPPLAPLHLKSAVAIGGGTQANAAALKTAVVTVLHDNISGSGFYVADGYVITNHHVVGTTHYVKIKLDNGRLLVGEVVRDDARRDIALIKTESAGVTPLHVSMAVPPVGEDVFAIGSPLGQELAGTFTRGVLSGAREADGLEFLQSDVAVNHGNSGGPLLDPNATVIGVTVSKITKGVGLSFFIPIREAANKLGLIFD